MSAQERQARCWARRWKRRWRFYGRRSRRVWWPGQWRVRRSEFSWRSRSWRLVPALPPSAKETQAIRVEPRELPSFRNAATSSPECHNCTEPTEWRSVSTRSSCDGRKLYRREQWGGGCCSSHLRSSRTIRCVRRRPREPRLFFCTHSQQRATTHAEAWRQRQDARDCRQPGRATSWFGRSLSVRRCEGLTFWIGDWLHHQPW